MSDPADGVVVEETGPHTERRGFVDRISGAALPILLAALGLAGALVAWRVGMAGDIASDANVAGLAAARGRSAQVVTAEGIIARTEEAWLDYERARRRAAALQAGDLPADALNDLKVAASHWFLVRPEYIDADGGYDREGHRAALLAQAASEEDIDPDPHFRTADVEYDRIRGLPVAGLVIAAALPLATLAALTRGRLRAASGARGRGVFLVGLVLAALAWV